MAHTLPPRSPGGGRPTQELAVQLGKHILEIALEQFVTHGVERASMEDIAAAAKVSKRTLYSRFGSKLALLVASIEHFVSEEVDLVSASVQAGSLRSQIIHVAGKLLDLSLRPDVVGVESLAMWLKKHEPELFEAKSDFGAKNGIRIFEDILENTPELKVEQGCNVVEFAQFLHDILIVIPRHRILLRHDLQNSAQAKSDYLERAMDMLTTPWPMLKSPGPA